MLPNFYRVQEKAERTKLWNMDVVMNPEITFFCLKVKKKNEEGARDGRVTG